MNLTLVITKNCKSCQRVEAQLRQLIFTKDNINLKIQHIKDFNKRGVAIVPALFTENELFSYGDFDEDKLLSKLLSSTKE